MTRRRNNHPFVIIIVLNWNDKESTLACLESLGRLHYPAQRTVVVDNGSTDGSTAAVQASFPETHVIQTATNLGYAGGNNVGLRFALRHGAEYVWILNNDTVVAPTALDALVASAHTDPAIAFTGSKIYFQDQPERLWYAGASIELDAGGRTSHQGYGEIDRGQFDTITDVGYVTGCSLLASRAAVEALGPLPEEYFLYFEETDWNITAHRKGFRTILAPASRVWHRHDLNKEQSPRYLYYFCRNRIHLVQKYAPSHARKAVGLNLELLRQTLATAPRRRQASLLLAGLLAHLDALRGRTGKAPWSIVQ